MLLSLSCANAADPAPGAAPAERAAPAAAPASEPDPAPAPPAARDAPARPAVAPLGPDATCEQREAHYLDLRAKENRCERDGDCAEIYPGLCPHGPYFMHVAGDHASIDAAARAVAEGCEMSECEMPMPLGISRCEAGRCVKGRTPGKDGPMKSCWDTQVTYMRTERPYLGSSSEHLQGITPLHAVGVPAAGTLRISARLGCTDCALKVSEHNTGMSNLIKGKPFTPAPRDPAKIRPVTSRAPPAMATVLHLEFPVTPGPYFIATIGGAPADVQYEVSLSDGSGAAMEPDRQGRVHLRICEG